MLRYHPTIAFKKTDEIIKHIANCAEGETNYYDNLKKGPFRIRVDSDGNSNNCESFVNRCVLGLNFSELAERKKENNNSRVMNLDIEEQLSKTRGDLDSLTSYTPWSTVNEIKGHRRASGYEDFTLMRDGIAMESRVEAQPKVNLFKDLIN